LAGERTRELFQEVVIPYLDDALSLARWLTGNIADAEDVVQDACIRAHGAIGLVKNSNPRSWIKCNPAETDLPTTQRATAKQLPTVSSSI
jgi:hypothetical protein